MEPTQALEQWFEQADQSLPVLTVTARWCVFGLGVVLWLAGGRLLKAACILGGAMLGMIVGGLSLAFVESVAVGIGFMIGLGMLGALGAWLMFRAWVALAAAVVFAIASPAAVMVWQGAPSDELAEDTQEAAAQIEERYNAAVDQLSEEAQLEVQSLIQQGDADALQEADAILQEQGEKAYQAAREIVFRNLEDVEAWWQSKDSAGVRTIGLAMLIGGGVGFLLGFLLPTHAAAMQSAIVGAVLIVIPGRELLVSYVPGVADLTPTTARGTLITIGLITIIGMVLQWTLYLRRDDKQA